MAAPKLIVLDSTPLALIVHRRGLAVANECRRWVTAHLAAGVRVVVPEIIDYEVRRELLRLGLQGSLTTLEAFESARPDRVIPLTSPDLRLAADLWAQARRRGMPTADAHALDVDVILAAQALSLGYDPIDFVIATSNIGHLAQFVPAALWSSI